MTKRIDEIGFGNLKLVQETEGFCYGTDAILLAYMVWKEESKLLKNIKAIADLGTGNGIVPLILSTKTDARILGLDVQQYAIDLACESARINKLESRLKFISGNVKDIETLLPDMKGTMDAVTMNPPYQEAEKGIISQTPEKAIARQEIEGKLADFLKAAKYLLKQGGHLYMVHRPGRLADIIYESKKLKLETKEIQMVSGKKGEAPNILMYHAVKGGKSELKILPEMTVREADGSFTEEMMAAYK